MPRNPDGTFTRVINWEEEQENVETFTGAKMDSDANDLAQGVEEALDSFGRNSLKNNIQCDGFRFRGAGNAVDLQDYATLDDIYKYAKPSIFMTDNGSISGLGSIRLKTELTNLPVGNGFRFTFQMPFLFGSEQIKLAGKYEDFELEIDGNIYAGNVVRGPLLKDPNDPNSIIDPLPSFFFNELANYGFIYDMEMLIIDGKNYFRVADNHLSGELIFYPSDIGLSVATTPAGYINLELIYNNINPPTNPISGGKFKMLQKIRSPANPSVPV